MSRSLKRMQHIDPFRKYLLRRHLLRWAGPGAVYLPFCGDADIAMGFNKDGGVLAHEKYSFPALYANRRIYAADLDEDRVTIAKSRITDGLVYLADCDNYPFKDVATGPIAVADLDAWAEPWPCFRSFWEHAEKADRLVIIFTDAHRMGIAVDGTLIRPDGSKRTFEPGVEIFERSRAFNFYLSEIVWPWLEDVVASAGYRVLDRQRYLRGMLTYHGVALELTGARRNGQRKPRRPRTGTEVQG